MSEEIQKAATVLKFIPSKKMRNHPQAWQVTNDTMIMVNCLLDDTAPTTELLKEWAKGISGERIDVNATVLLSNQSTHHSAQRKPVWLALLEQGRWGANELYPAILDRVDELNHTSVWPYDYHSLLHLIRSRRADFVEVFLKHPHVDVNRLLGQEDYTLLDVCFSRLAGSLLHGIQWSKEQAEHYATILLERDAVMPLRLTLGYLSEPETQPSFSLLGPFVVQWQAELDDFVSGRLNPESLSAAQLGHFYSLGHLSESMEPEHWHGHEMLALDLYDQLPAWVQEQQPCLDQRHLLMARMFPTPQVQGWSAAIEPAKREHVR